MTSLHEKAVPPASRVWLRAVSWRSPHSLGRTWCLEHKAASSQEARCHRQRLIYGRQKTADTSVICCTLKHVSTSLQWVLECACNSLSELRFCNLNCSLCTLMWADTNGNVIISALNQTEFTPQRSSEGNWERSRPQKLSTVLGTGYLVI